ncbi:hypothetical protein [Burkholderia pseudomallei]|uniref:hypothetical protein n=1 Tax=Burkholderia pseudomallei TaxID=28450 RepID=UPI001AD6229E|nr:hypothetical protein [Burkholderia pseudomallei]MBO7825937.1 hypothetical protein [Burkholderia pseudomallei]
MISEPRMGRITQGTVFCGGRAEEYTGLPVWGVVITARCDTTHEKTPIVNYLPVVRIEDWLLGHGGMLSIDRELAEVRNRFRNLLTKKQLSASLLEVHAPAEVAELHFPVPAADGSNKAAKDAKDATDARQLASLVSQFEECLRNHLPNRDAILRAVAECQKSVEAIVRELIGHKLAGYYFLPSLGKLTENHSENGYVVLLREVHHMPRMGVTQLIEGISKDALDPKVSRGLSFDCFDFAFPVAELDSPWTEHLMQSFCNLFGRIGVADVDKKLVTQILDHIEFKK